MGTNPASGQGAVLLSADGGQDEETSCAAQAGKGGLAKHFIMIDRKVHVSKARFELGLASFDA